MYHRFPFSSLYSTSRSDIAVLSFGSQFTMYGALYIRPSLYSFEKASLTALANPSSSVNLCLVQSQEAPIVSICFFIVSLATGTHSQTFSINFSLPSSNLFIPFSSSCFVTTHCVAIPAWSNPGSQRVLNPFILLYLIDISCSVILRACPI